MDSIASWLGQLQWDKALELLITASAAILCITFHETCHGLAALALGDQTAKRMGRLSLNPLKHVDLGGLLMLMIAKVGWAKPVPVDARHFREPRIGMAIVSIAGPLSNVLLSAIAAAGYTASMFYAIYLEQAWLNWLGEFFYYVFYISAGLAVFNLLPIPPLDGSRLLFSVLPDRLYYTYLRYERYLILAVIALAWFGFFSGPLNVCMAWVLEKLCAVTRFPFVYLSYYFGF